MREVKYRYVVIELSDGAIDPREVEEYIAKLIQQLFGIQGLSQTLPRVVFQRKNIFVVRVRREGLKILRASLALDLAPRLFVLKTTGTIRKASRIASSWGRPS
ncbi:MAG: Rpp14/Pop5 family protein [Infirmifilum sp.]